MAFLASLVCVALIIFLLSVILAAIDRNETENARDTDNKDTPSNNQGDQANAEQLVAAIANAIHTYRRYRQSDESYRAKRENTTIIVLGFTAIFALIAAGATIYSAWIFSGQLNEMQQDRRAWLSPSRIEWFSGKPPKAGADISALLVYGNIGREPALDYGGRYHFGLFEPDPTFSYANMHFGENMACNGLESNPGGPTIYPAPSADYRTELVIPAGYINDNVIRGLTVTPSALLLPIVYVQGCLAYRTLGRTGRSEYCFYLHPDIAVPLLKWTFRACGDGNHAE